jgi:hypothetical protein
MDARKVAAEAKAKALADLKAAEEMERAAEEIAQVADKFGWNVDIVFKSSASTTVVVEAKNLSAADVATVQRFEQVLKKRGGKAPDPNSMTSRSKAESVKIVRELQRPVPLGEMARRLEERGVKLGGKKPSQALSANLGNCPELRSTPRGWWLVGVPIPREDKGKMVGGGEQLPGLN